MSEPEPNDIKPVARVQNPLRCGKCGTFHDRDVTDCTKCGTHLWVNCRRCRARNPRTYSRCGKCGRRLARLSQEWLDWLLYSESPAKRTLLAVLLALAGLVALTIMLKIMVGKAG